MIKFDRYNIDEKYNSSSVTIYKKFVSYFSTSVERFIPIQGERSKEVEKSIFEEENNKNEKELSKDKDENNNPNNQSNNKSESFPSSTPPSREVTPLLTVSLNVPENEHWAYPILPDPGPPPSNEPRPTMPATSDQAMAWREVGWEPDPSVCNKGVEHTPITQDSSEVTSEDEPMDILDPD